MPSDEGLFFKTSDTDLMCDLVDGTIRSPGDYVNWRRTTRGEHHEGIIANASSSADLELHDIYEEDKGESLRQCTEYDDD